MVFLVLFHPQKKRKRVKNVIRNNRRRKKIAIANRKGTRDRKEIKNKNSSEERKPGHLKDTLKCYCS